jgi:hypothetical protein
LSAPVVLPPFLIAGCRLCMPASPLPSTYLGSLLPPKRSRWRPLNTYYSSWSLEVNTTPAPRALQTPGASSAVLLVTWHYALHAGPGNQAADAEPLRANHSAHHPHPEAVHTYGVNVASRLPFDHSEARIILRAKTCPVMVARQPRQIGLAGLMLLPVPFCAEGASKHER